MPASSRPKRRLKSTTAAWIATSFGLGYIPVAPGTWGSLVGLILYWMLNGYFRSAQIILSPAYFRSLPAAMNFAVIAAVVGLAIAIVGVWSADHTAKSAGVKDPQFVVIDEVSGQHLTYALALVPLNWKYLLLGFILFRAFDIWKPFPARQAESLPGGLGIMADDWAAGLYAALGLWLARRLGM